MSRITTLLTRYRDREIGFYELSVALSTMPMQTQQKTAKTVEELIGREGLEPLEEGTWEEVDQAVARGLITPDEGQRLNQARWAAQGHSKL